MACRRSAVRSRSAPPESASRAPVAVTGASVLRRVSAHRVLDRLHRARAHGLARRLGGEHLLLLGERVDALARRTRGLLHDDELREAVEHEDAVLLELLVTDAHQRLDDLFDVLARHLLADPFGDRLEDRALRER